MSNLNTIISQLDSNWKALALRWEETKKVWNDPVYRDFEKEYWDVLERQVRVTQNEMERLAQVIAGARRQVK
jgi:hypothetical protein